jgi:hypothetical protein
MKQLFVMAVPILPGKTEEWMKFRDELNTTYASQFAESRRNLGVHERTFLQSTPMGELVIVTLEGEDPQGAFLRFGQMDDSFSQWFKERVSDLHGIDVTVPPEQGMVKLVLDSEKMATVLQN